MDPINSVIMRFEYRVKLHNEYSKSVCSRYQVRNAWNAREAAAVLKCLLVNKECSFDRKHRAGS